MGDGAAPRSEGRSGPAPRSEGRSGPGITLVRHGETEWSKSGRHTGRTDVALTEAGEAEAKALGGVLAGEHFDLVLVSPRQRARRTAELAGLIDPVIDDDVQEWDYGELEGLTTAEIRQRWPGWRIWTGPWPGGETADQVGARADRVISQCIEQPPEATIALVAHGHMLRVIGARWVGAPVAAGGWLELGTAAVCRLGWEHDAPTLQLWNYTSDSVGPTRQ